MCVDISNYYLNNIMDRYEYMKLPLKIIPEDIIQKYRFRNLAQKGIVYTEVQKRMCGIPQAGKMKRIN